MEKKGKSRPIRITSRPCNIMFIWRKPGRPSYHMEAKSCWTLGWATNWKIWRIGEGFHFLNPPILGTTFPLGLAFHNIYSTLSNKRTGTNYRILRRNLDQGCVIIFYQWKWFWLIDWMPGFTSYRGLGIKSINQNHFHWSKIITEPLSRFFFLKVQ